MRLRVLGAGGGLSALVSVSVLWGQLTTATIVGIVRDQTKAVLPSVAITVRNVDTGVVRNTTTNAQGYYVVPNLIPGNYEVEASMSGFQTGKRSGFALTVGSERSDSTTGMNFTGRLLPCLDEGEPMTTISEW